MGRLETLLQGALLCATSAILVLLGAELLLHVLSQRARHLLQLSCDVAMRVQHSSLYWNIAHKHYLVVANRRSPTAHDGRIRHEVSERHFQLPCRKILSLNLITSYFSSVTNI